MRPNRLVVLSLSAAMLFAACSSASPSSSTPAAAGSDAVPSASASPAPFDEATAYAAAQQEGRIVWKDIKDLDIAQQFIDAFQAKYPGVVVDYQLESDGNEARWIAEFRAGRLSVDVHKPTIAWTAYKDAGMIQDLTDVYLAAGIAPEAITEGIAQDEFLVGGIAYNPNLVPAADAPKTWEDALDPKYKGQIVVDENLRPFVHATEFWGRDKVVDYLTRLKAQEPKFARGDSATAALLMAGEAQLHIGAFLGSVPERVGQPWVFADLDEVFSVETYVNGLTVFPSAPHPNAGRLFVYWYMGPEGREISDKIRFRGDPRPGTGSGPSKYLEEHGIKVEVAPAEYDVNFEKYRLEYLEILGAPVN